LIKCDQISSSRSS